MLDECKVELRAKAAPFDEKIAVGAMIEIPSAAAIADLLAEKCDFFSIGTNDLIQYLLAIDRGNDRIAHLYEPTHPAVLRTLRHIIEAAKPSGIPVSVCGEMAGDPVYTPLLLGLGIQRLSMTPAWIPTVKFLIRAMKMTEAKALAEQAMTMSSAKDIYAMCDAFYRSRAPVG
jgi:phosphotransferase system enzyme I (PtsI)